MSVGVELVPLLLFPLVGAATTKLLEGKSPMSLRVEMNPEALAQIKAAVKEAALRQEVSAALPFTEEKTLLVTLKRAGLTVQKTGGVLIGRTREGLSFYLRPVAGAWHAVFTKADDKTQVAALLEKLSKITGEALALVPAKNGAATFATPFRDTGLLAQALSRQGASLCQMDEDTWETTIDHVTLHFERQQDGALLLCVAPGEDLNAALSRLKVLETDHGALVQQQVLAQLKQHLAQPGPFSVFSEETLEDGTVMITLNVE